MSIDDYEEFLKANNNKFRAPDKPSEEISSQLYTPRKMISKLNTFTRQLTGGSIDSNDSIDSPKSLPPEDPNGEIPKSDSSHSLDISNSRILWKVTPRPENSPQYYYFDAFTYGLNEFPQDSAALEKLPCTDSRFRPDIRKLEKGDLGQFIDSNFFPLQIYFLLDGAALEKNRLEEKQREVRRLRKKQKDKEHEPL